MRLIAGIIQSEMSRFLAEKLSMTDKLIAEKINKLERPITVVFAGGAEWELSDIDVETGLLRIFVSGLLEVREVGEVMSLIDGTGNLTQIECFYSDYEVCPCGKRATCTGIHDGTPGCENQARANAIARLTNSGRITQLAGALFPWCKMQVRSVRGS